MSAMPHYYFCQNFEDLLTIGKSIKCCKEEAKIVHLNVTESEWSVTVFDKVTTKGGYAGVRSFNFCLFILFRPTKVIFSCTSSQGLLANTRRFKKPHFEIRLRNTGHHCHHVIGALHWCCSPPLPEDAS